MGEYADYQIEQDRLADELEPPELCPSCGEVVDVDEDDIDYYICPECGYRYPICSEVTSSLAKMVSGINKTRKEVVK